MSEATIRTLLYNIVNGVTDIGKVHDHFRYSNELPTWLGFYQTTINGQVQIRGWSIANEGFSSEETNTCKVLRRHRFRIRGYMSVIDSIASEKVMSALAETVANALDDATTIRASSYPDTPPASIDVMEHRLFGGDGGALCHYVEITQGVNETRASV